MEKLQNFLTTKRLLLAAVIAVFFVILGFALSTTSSEKNSNPQPQAGPAASIHPTQYSGEIPPVENRPSRTPSPNPSQAAALQAAMNEAKQSAKAYDTWQDQLRQDFPWIRTLPYASEKYFVYFSLDGKFFIARLYPKAGDDVEQMKEQILAGMKARNGIPVENYRFEWRVAQQN